MSETALMRQIRFAVNSTGYARVFRNNVGTFYSRDGTPVRCGLSVGSGDLIGWVTTKVGVAALLSLEVKTPKGRIDDEQLAWQASVRRAGGIAEIVRSVEEALAVVKKAAEQP